MKILEYTQASFNFLKDLERHVNHEYAKSRNSTTETINSTIEELQKSQMGWITIKIDKKQIEELERIRSEESKYEDVMQQPYTAMLALLDNIFYGYPSSKDESSDEVKLISDPSIAWERTFYNIYLKRDETTKEKSVEILIKDFIAIPKDFICSYFGYDTGISGLNQLMMGGFLLPKKSTAMITVDGESGAGKTTFLVNLVCALLKNCDDPRFMLNKSKTKIHYKKAEPLSFVIDYFILEQSYTNILRCITSFDLLCIYDEKTLPTGLSKDEVVYIQEEKEDCLKLFKKVNNTKKLVMSIHPVPMCSAADLLHKVQVHEESFQKSRSSDERHIVVIDSINAVLDMDVEQSKWRQVLQAFRSILDTMPDRNSTKQNNTILLLTQEKDPSIKDTMVEYFCDVVMGFEKRNINGEYLRYIELIESRFQDMCYGRHPFHFSTKGQAPFGIYPSASALMELIPNQLKQIQPIREMKEYGIKIDGIINFFEYTHLKKPEMKPYFLKNSVSLLNGEKGCHKSSFSKFFTLSSYRDEKWVFIKEDNFTNDNFLQIPIELPGDISEINYSQTEADKIWTEMKEVSAVRTKKGVLRNAYPIDKAIGLIVKFGENYEENEYDKVIDAPWGKVIIPANAFEKKPEIWGNVSDVICHFEVRNFSEEYYLEQIMDVIRALESFAINEIITDNFDDLFCRIKLSRILWEKANLKTDNSKDDPIKFSPSKAIYQGKDYLTEHATKSKLIEYEKFDFSYKITVPIKVRRLVLDNTENLIDIFKQIEAQDLITTITHFGLAKGITIIIVNQISKGSRNQINDISNAIADNIFEFQREYFCGEWYSVFHIKRSSSSWHNRMYYNIHKRHDGLLELMDTFAFVSSFHNELKELIPIRLFLPGKSQSEFDMYANLQVKLNEKYPDSRSFIYDRDKKSPLPYKDSHEQWHKYLKEMIIYSMTHPVVEIIKASDPFTDISIIIEDESVKDALTISCIPGHLINRYKSNLLRITDYINMSPKNKLSTPTDNKVFLSERWMGLNQVKKDHKEGRFGKTNYFLKPSSLSFVADDAHRNANPLSWIEPDLLFNPVLDISHNQADTNIRTAHALAYPFYINPRLNLIIRRKDYEGTIEVNHFGSATTEDYFTMFLELLFSYSIIEPGEAMKQAVSEFIGIAKQSSIGYQVDDISALFEADPDAPGYKPIFVSRNWFASHQQFLEILTNNLSTDQLNQLCIKYQVPDIFTYATWYLGVPLNSPRKDRACEIIVKMTEYHDLANFQLNGIGIQLSNYVFEKDTSYKYYPELAYEQIRDRIRNFKAQRTAHTQTQYGIPLAALDCFYELITPIGGILQNVHRLLKSLSPSCVDDDADFSKLQARMIKQITSIFKAYASDNKCNQCYFNYLTSTQPSGIACGCWLGQLFGLKSK